MIPQILFASSILSGRSLFTELSYLLRSRLFFHSFRPSDIKKAKKVLDGARNRCLMAEISTVRHVFGHFDVGHFAGCHVRPVGMQSQTQGFAGELSLDLFSLHVTEK